jgi:F0F1-type ATP synthase assembly protein I
MVRERNKYLEQFGRFYTLAIEMAVAVIVPMLIGLWLDKKTGKSPWFTLAGTILGGAAAIRSAHRTLSEALREREKKEREHSTHEGRNGGFSS